MRLIVEMHGDLRQYLTDGEKRMEVEVEEGTTVGEFAARMGVTEDEERNAALRDDLAYTDDPRVEGAVLRIFHPLAGASSVKRK